MQKRRREGKRRKKGMKAKNNKKRDGTQGKVKEILGLKETRKKKDEEEGKG